MHSWLTENNPTIVLAAIAFISMFLSFYFLEISGFSVQSILVFDLMKIIQTILSIEFWLFALFFSIATGIFLFMFLAYEKLYSLVASISPALMAFIAAFFLFSVAQELLIVMAFYIIGLVTAQFITKTRFSEVKKLRSLRAAATGAGKLCLIISLGFLASGILEVAPQQEEYAEEFEEMFIGSFARAGAATTADAMVRSRRDFLREIIESDEFTGVRTMPGPEAEHFVRYMDAVVTEVFSPEYKEKVMSEFEEAVEDDEFREEAFERIPFYGMLKSGLFILLPLHLALLFWVFGQIVIKNVAAATTAIIAKMRKI